MPKLGVQIVLAAEVIMLAPYSGTFKITTKNQISSQQNFKIFHWQGESKENSKLQSFYCG